ncbi:DUF1993 domain-containing protein [Betaproteobacteria bacterium]|nr:DUF1993 domain-containing protein [Betaproteobacteria bacterium]
MEMYDLSVPIFKKKLSILFAILKRTSQQAINRSLNSEDILNAQLTSDMWNFTRQVQMTTDFIKNGVARLAVIKFEAFEDNEKSLAELQARLIKTISCLNKVKPEQINGSENRIIEIEIRKTMFELTGYDFLQNFVTPNVYFHLSIAYGILRAKNIDLSKVDYLGHSILQKRKQITR